VDLIFCHRPDPDTPIQETVRAMNWVIDQGWALYWGTSEWSAQQIKEVSSVQSRTGWWAWPVQYWAALHEAVSTGLGASEQGVWAACTLLREASRLEGIISCW
jgi:hypothetical protein